MVIYALAKGEATKECAMANPKLEDWMSKRVRIKFVQTRDENYVTHTGILANVTNCDFTVTHYTITAQGVETRQPNTIFNRYSSKLLSVELA
ncbi:MAG: hypothetical protein JNN11_00995 [Candidatus Doudnabacteria bacterium]|nr:hypothetical protein [Candidatus Doudnabacteria bacterium]